MTSCSVKFLNETNNRVVLELEGEITFELNSVPAGLEDKVNAKVGIDVVLRKGDVDQIRTLVPLSLSVVELGWDYSNLEKSTGQGGGCQCYVTGICLCSTMRMTSKKRKLEDSETSGNNVGIKLNGNDGRNSELNVNNRDLLPTSSDPIAPGNPVSCCGNSQSQSEQSSTSKALSSHENLSSCCKQRSEEDILTAANDSTGPANLVLLSAVSVHQNQSCSNCSL